MFRRVTFTIRTVSILCAAGGISAAVLAGNKPAGLRPAAPPARPTALATVKDIDLLDQEQALRTIRGERLRKEVLRTIEASRKQASRDPNASLGELKRALTTVISLTDIDPDVRESLCIRLQVGIEQLLVIREKTEQDRIRIGTAAFWRRRTMFSIDGIAIPALCEADRLGFAALHLLRHVLRNDARPAHAFELARFLLAHGDDESFWAGWRSLRNPHLRTLELTGLRFAAEWFGVPNKLAPAGCLPENVEAWFQHFAWSPIANLAGGNKDVVWLHLALLENWRDRAAVLRRRLAPLRLPHQDASFAERLRYHAAALAPALSSGLRWRLRRNTVSTAPQISDWKRGSV